MLNLLLFVRPTIQFTNALHDDFVQSQKSTTQDFDLLDSKKDCDKACPRQSLHAKETSQHLYHMRYA
jgi:hypothetical protein